MAKLAPEQRRFIGLVVAFTMICGGILGGLWWMSLEDETKKPLTPTAELSDNDQQQIRSVVDQFITSAGRFGVREDTALKPETLFAARAAVMSNSRISPDYWDARPAVYANVKSLIASASPLSYPEAVYSTWDETMERERMASFRSTASEINVPTRSSMMNYQNNTVPTVNVTLTLSSAVRQHLQSIDDSSWDGTFEVSESSMSETVTISMVQAAGEWKIYDIQMTHPYLLVTWGDPSQVNSGYYSMFSSAKNVGSIRAELPNAPTTAPTAPTSGTERGADAATPAG